MRFLPIFALVAFIAAALAPDTATAQVPPTRFWGVVYINGEIAPPGTEIRAFIHEFECGYTMIEGDDGLYILDVAHDFVVFGCAFMDGERVFFTINGVPAAQEGAFAQGNFVNIDLSPLE